MGDVWGCIPFETHQVERPSAVPSWSGLPLHTHVHSTCPVAVYIYTYIYVSFLRCIWLKLASGLYVRQNPQPCDPRMPRGCYRCTLDYFEDESTCHWIYLTEVEDNRMVKAGLSTGLVIWGQGCDKKTYAPLCARCVAFYLNMIEQSTRPQFDGFQDEATAVLSHAVLEYVGDQVRAGKLQGGYE